LKLAVLAVSPRAAAVTMTMTMTMIRLRNVAELTALA